MIDTQQAKLQFGIMLSFLALFIVIFILSTIDKDSFFITLSLIGIVAHSISSIVLYRRYKRLQ